MKYTYTHFISENVAPKGATRIVVKNGENEVCSVPASRFGSLTPPEREPPYSFGIISDAHMGYNSYDYYNPAPENVGTRLDDGNGYGWTPNGTNLRNALAYMADKVDFCCCAGDFTNIGLYTKQSGTPVFYPYQMHEYYDICALFPTMTFYNIIGNHENYYEHIPTTDLTEDVTLPNGKTFTAGTPVADVYKYYTGNDLNYTVEREGDLFIFVSQTTNSLPMSDDTFNWLATTLEANKDRRCFVFVHSFIDENTNPADGGIVDSGNPCFARDNSLFGYWGKTKTTNFMNLLKQYEKVVLFHGHSHMKFESQEFDKNANYTTNNGFRSVHIPSLGDPRILTGADGSWGDDKFGGQFYIVDVYDDCIVLNGMYVHKENKDSTTLKVAPIPLGTYKIEV